MTSRTFSEKKLKQFNLLKENIPGSGDTLRGMDGEAIRIRTEWKPAEEKGGKKSRTMYVNALIDPDCLGWWLSNYKDGLKILVCPESQEKLLEKYGVSHGNITVKALRIIRRGFKNSSLVAEIIEGEY